MPVIPRSPERTQLVPVVVAIVACIIQAMFFGFFPPELASEFGLFRIFAAIPCLLVFVFLRVCLSPRLEAGAVLLAQSCFVALIPICFVFGLSHGFVLNNFLANRQMASGRVWAVTI